jgi:hypothetical protein
MIPYYDLRIGNKVYWNPHFSHSNVVPQIQVEIAALLPEKAGYIRSHLEHRVEPFEDDVMTKEIPYARYEDLEPIPLSELFFKQGKKIKYPDWIRYIHELQNWYYWNNNKTELEINE